jgi:hypothetical protein
MRPSVSTALRFTSFELTVDAAAQSYGFTTSHSRRALLKDVVRAVVLVPQLTSRDFVDDESTGWSSRASGFIQGDTADTNVGSGE